MHLPITMAAINHVNNEQDQIIKDHLPGILRLVGLAMGQFKAAT